MFANKDTVQIDCLLDDSFVHERSICGKRETMVDNKGETVEQLQSRSWCVDETGSIITYLRLVQPNGISVRG